MEDRNIQTRQETYYRLYNRIQSISYEGRNKQSTCNILIEEKHMSRYYKDYIGIPTDGSI